MTLPIIHSILLILTIAFSFFWTNNPGMSNFSFQLVGLLTIIFFFHDLISRKTRPNNPIQTYRNMSNSIILTLLTLLLVLSTNGLNSPLFFILDFLVLGLSLFFYPSLGFSFSLALTLAFLLNNDLTSTHALTNLISLLLMAPFARFFSTQYLQLLEGKQQIKILKYQADRLENKIEQEEASTLLWLSIEFKHKLDHALDLVSQISSNLSNIPYHQQDLLKALYSDLKELFKSGQTLQKQIDELTDDDEN
jgi:hypothetical protein